MSRTSVVKAARRTAWVGVLACAFGCASTPTPVKTTAPAAEAFEEYSLHVRAAEANARAAAAEGEHSEGMFKSVQLRAATANSFEDGDGTQGAVRLQLDNPFRTSEATRSLEAAGEAAAFEAEAQRYQANADTCEESVEARVFALRKGHIETYRAQLTQLLTRTRAFQSAGTLDPMGGARTELQLSRRLLEARLPGVGLRAHPQLGALPEPTEVAQPLDGDPTRLTALIAEKHPEVRAHLSAASEHKHAATSERRSRIPFVDYLQLDMDSRAGAPNLGGRLALEIPLDTGARGRAERHAHLSVGETYEAMSQAALLSQLASAALLELQGFEGDAAQQRSILEQADRADGLAQRFLEGQGDTPDRIAQLLSEAHEGRMAVLDARERAGKAACLLEYATGTSYAKWPRRAVTERPATSP
jgi:hypothetical protein